MHVPEKPGPAPGFFVAPTEAEFHEFRWSVLIHVVGSAAFIGIYAALDHYGLKALATLLAMMGLVALPPKFWLVFGSYYTYVEALRKAHEKGPRPPPWKQKWSVVTYVALFVFCVFFIGMVAWALLSD
ncbi:hypothetical protein [Usitatibacter palustris]|uniref:Uncharacterized protein n=1 Tax=Usitatibacter palustris TaxID=2732487 RepID=A0A6M4HAZ1_9PROT|nr:hypothetical protein [Usitatibacter palustris]QJR15624.1 hypothetical protein DSM104440_02446 [Usitatibacter palustris]